MAKVGGGYGYTFVDAPPKSLECSICLLTLREPHVTTCCGNHFCYSCINRVSNNEKPCPLCNVLGFKTFLHKGMEREVNALTIYCPNKPQGCDWQGELGQVEQHLNPEDESRKNGCAFVVLDCKYKCGGRFQLNVITRHETEECPKRSLEIQVVSVMKMLSLVKAELQTIKEENRVLSERSKAEVQAIREENRSLKEKNRTIEAKLSALIAENATLKQQIKSCQQVQLPPFYFAILNYEHYKKINYRAHSPPFYSHSAGYKMRVDIFVNGFNQGRGSHLSLYIFLLRGEYDDALQWPFKGRVVVEMYNSKMSKWIEYKYLDFDSAPIKRPDECETNTASGCEEFMSHDLLRKEYLVPNDVVRFRIIRVDSYK